MPSQFGLAGSGLRCHLGAKSKNSHFGTEI